MPRRHQQSSEAENSYRSVRGSRVSTHSNRYRRAWRLGVQRTTDRRYPPGQVERQPLAPPASSPSPSPAPAPESFPQHGQSHTAGPHASSPSIQVVLQAQPQPANEHTITSRRFSHEAEWLLGGGTRLRITHVSTITSTAIASPSPSSGRRCRRCQREPQAPAETADTMVVELFLPGGLRYRVSVPAEGGLLELVEEEA